MHHGLLHGLVLDAATMIPTCLGSHPCMHLFITFIHFFLVIILFVTFAEFKINLYLGTCPQAV